MSQHEAELDYAAWSQRIETTGGRSFVLFSRMERAQTAIVVTASDEQLSALVARGKTTCVTSSSTAKQPLATA